MSGALEKLRPSPPECMCEIRYKLGTANLSRFCNGGRCALDIVKATSGVDQTSIQLSGECEADKLGPAPQNP